MKITEFPARAIDPEFSVPLPPLTRMVVHGLISHGEAAAMTN